MKIRIASYDLVCKNYDSSNLGSLNILATIPVEASNFGLILYDNISNIESILGVSILDGFDLEFYDDDSNLINFNNIDWNLTLVLSITRTRQDKSKTSFKSLINPIMKLIKMEKQNLSNSSTNDGTDNADLGTADTTDTTDPTDEDDDNNLDVLLYNNNGKI